MSSKPLVDIRWTGWGYYDFLDLADEDGIVTHVWEQCQSGISPNAKLCNVIQEVYQYALEEVDKIA